MTKASRTRILFEAQINNYYPSFAFKKIDLPCDFVLVGILKNQMLSSKMEICVAEELHQSFFQICYSKNK